MAVNMSYPKPRSTQVKMFAIAREDNGTSKCVLPKGAIVVGAYVILSGACAGTTATISCGYGGSANELVAGFVVSTADAGYHAVATKAGADVIAGTKQTADRIIKSTYAAGDSGETTGALGFIKLEYFVPGPGETIAS
jgi:hypothetical protein